jgi:predicted lipoprotein with Yx(FWY)xxD motif
MRVRLRWAGIVLAVALLVAACGDDDTTEPTASSQPAGAQSTTATSPNTTAVVAADVNVATNELGQILVDSDGVTLYVLTADSAGVSTCVDACAQAWPPLIATSVTTGNGLDEADFTLIARPDGTQQIAVNDQPLYRFAGDTAAGETSGQGLNDVWYVAGADGQPVRTPTG